MEDAPITGKTVAVFTAFRVFTARVPGMCLCIRFVVSPLEYGLLARSRTWLAPFAAAMITAPTNEKAGTADAYLTVLSHGEIARPSFPGSGPGRRGELDGFLAPYFALGRSYRSSRPTGATGIRQKGAAG